MTQTLKHTSISLLPWSISLASQVRDACQDKTMQDHLPITVPYTLKSAVDFIQNLVPEFFAAGGANFAVVKETTTPFVLLGCVSVRLVDPEKRHARVGYWVSKDARNQGVATGSVELIKKWAFANNFSSLELTIAKNNFVSKKVANACGFDLYADIENYLLRNDFTLEPTSIFILRAP